MTSGRPGRSVRVDCVRDPLARSVVAAPPAWIDSNRLVVVTGDAGEPTATIVDAETGELSDGPPGARLIATSATAAGSPPWPGRAPRSSSVTRPPGWGTTDRRSRRSHPRRGDDGHRIRLDATGQRLVIAWADRKGAVTLAIHDARADWRRIAQPAIGPARGAVVACYARRHQESRVAGSQRRPPRTENRAADRAGEAAPSTGASAPQGA